jgi:1-acyl-sn-glycerol-3-phosphate acyltransferase
MFATILPPFLRGIFVLLGITLFTLALTSFVFVLAFLKWLMPGRTLRTYFSRKLDRMPVIWASSVAFVMHLFTRVNYNVEGLEKVGKVRWSLLLANHQSWTDVIAMHMVFNRRVPVMKFFIKWNIRYVPFLGWACVFIGFPFMKRFTKEQVAKNPELKGQDIAATKKSCERFKDEPVTIVSFPEGTRFTKSKAARQKTPYKHLLKPKAGGVAYTLTCMGDYLESLINVTIIYPNNDKQYWRYVCGKIKQIDVIIDVLPIDPSLIGDYENDRAFRVHIQQWINTLWAEKDKQIEAAQLRYRGDNAN